MRNVDGDYQYIVKGKNGEPKRGVLVDFEFNHEYYYSSRSKTLKTDKEGTVHLGNLKNIRMVSYHIHLNSKVQCTTSLKPHHKIVAKDLGVA